MQRPTMTLKECAEEMRSHGFRTSERTIAAGISIGHYPFGGVVATGKTGRRTFEISKVKFQRWIEENTSNE